MIKQITTAGCNRECFALTENGELFLLRYRTPSIAEQEDEGLPSEIFKWEKIETPPRQHGMQN